jgi:hypothetical protein
MNQKINSTSMQGNLLDRFSSAAQSDSRAAEARRICVNHKDRAGDFYCSNCRIWRCKDCSRVFDGVAVCQSCDSLATSARRLDERNYVGKKDGGTFSSYLMRSLTFPFRHLMLPISLTLIAWPLSSAMDSFVYGSDSPGFMKLLTGPLNLGVGLVVAFGIISIAMTASLVARANGKEGLVVGDLDDVRDLAEPAGLWLSAAIIGFAPLVIWLGYHKLQIILVMVITGGDYTHILEPEPSTWRYAVTVMFSLWALFFYPMALVVAAAQRSIWSVLNPFASISAWITLREWVKLAFFSVILVLILTAVAIHAVEHLSFGQAGSILIASIALLAVSQMLGVAVFKGLERLPTDHRLKVSVGRLHSRRG